MKRIPVLLTTIGVALATCSTAFANALEDGHGSSSQPGNFGQFKPPNGTAGTHTSGVGTLPFTGFNLALIAAAALVLLASGLVLHRMARRQQ